MLLSDTDLLSEIESGRFVIDPFDEDLLQPSSIDIRLDQFFRVFDIVKFAHIDPSQQQDNLTTLVKIELGDPFILHPGDFVLGSTVERVSIPSDLAGRLEGKSSLGRLGLLTHATAGFIDAGFVGNITLELVNVSKLPMKLWPGMRIGQLCMFRLTSPAQNLYGSSGLGSRYQNQVGPTSSRSYVDFQRWIETNSIPVTSHH